MTDQLDQTPLFEEAPTVTRDMSLVPSWNDLNDNQRMVLSVIRHFTFAEGDADPFTDIDLCKWYRYAWEERIGLGLQLQAESGIRTRRHELTELGLVKEYGNRKSGRRKHKLWVLA